MKPQGRCEFYAAPIPEPEEGEEPAEEVEPETSPALLSTLDADAESDAIDWGAAVTAKNEEGEEVQEGTARVGELHVVHGAGGEVPGDRD